MGDVVKQKILAGGGALWCTKSTVNKVRLALKNLGWLKDSKRNVLPFSETETTIDQDLPLPQLFQLEKNFAVFLNRKGLEACLKANEDLLERSKLKKYIPDKQLEDWLFCMKVIFVEGLRPNPKRSCEAENPDPKARKVSKPEDTRFTFVELFAGIGGFHAGLAPLGGQCLLASEIDKEAVAIYKKNFPNTKVVGDITDFSAKDLPAVDLLVGGFPCQSFSKAGDQQGFDHDNGLLFFELARIARECNARALLLENVPNLLEIDNGGAWKTIEKTLQDSGYPYVYKKVINAKYLVPQNRERLYIAAFRTRPKVDIWPEENIVEFPMTHENNIKFPIVKNILQETDFEDCILTDAQWQRVQATPSYQNSSCGRLVNINGSARTLRGRYRSGYQLQSEFVPVPGSDKPRFFTARECARLQGFDDDFIIESDRNSTHVYKKLGNAVPPPLIHAIAATVLSNGLEINNLIR